jgi:flagellar P-ring protein precursor FlgI
MRPAAALLLFLLSAAGSLDGTPAPPVKTRLKDLINLEGVRENPLVGYGLVVGLNGTGDKRQTIFSNQTLANLLDRMGVQVSPAAIQVRNTAAVLVTANLPPFAQPGLKIDVAVAAIGDSTNLQGGLLIMTPLRAADGLVFAAAQGQVVTGGFSAGRGGGNSTTVNHPTAGRVPAGAIVERAAPSTVGTGPLKLQLRQADFSTASRLAAAINEKFPGQAKPVHSGLVSVDVPEKFANRTVEFVAELESLAIEADRPARVIINEKTGTIVLGQEVRIRPVSILHGALSVEVRTTYDVSQPAPLSDGKTTAVPQVSVAAKEEAAKSVRLQPGATVDDLVRALTSVGATPRDIIAVLQNLRAAGALEAELEVI